MTPYVCSRCGTDESVELVENPYTMEIYGESVEEWLCPDCYHECLMDI